MQTSAAHEELGDLLARLCHPRRWNDAHRVVASLLLDGTFSHAITTNYDACLEQACEQQLTGRVAVVVKEDDFDASKSGPVIFKIHGCARHDQQVNRRERTMVFQLADEDRLPQWKEALLHRLLAGRWLIVMGYSGIDNDICPVLARIPLKGLIWLHLSSTKPSAGAMEVLSSHSHVVAFGTITELLKYCDQQVELHVPKQSSSTFHDMLTSLSLSDADLWRARLFNTLGAARAATRASAQLLISHKTEQQHVEALLMSGAAKLHAGRYYEAALAFDDASRHAFSIKDWNSHFAGEVGAIESRRHAGLLRSAWRRLRELERTMSTSETSVVNFGAEIMYLEASILSDAIRLLQACHHRSWSESVRKCGQRLLKERAAAQSSPYDGRHHSVEFFAGRLVTSPSWLPAKAVGLVPRIRRGANIRGVRDLLETTNALGTFSVFVPLALALRHRPGRHSLGRTLETAFRRAWRLCQMTGAKRRTMAARAMGLVD